MNPARISGCILAGGKSERMGRDKAFLRLGGRTLLELQAEKLRALGIRDLLISGTAGLPGVRTVPDLLPDRGPLGGLYAALCTAEYSSCLVLSVDTPLVPVEALAALIEAHTGGATLLSHRGRDEPLIAVYDCAAAERILPLIAEGGAPVRALPDLASARRVVYEGPEALLRNCNRPEDFSAVKEIYERHHTTCAEEEWRN